jgi:hypothetical protein
MARGNSRANSEVVASEMRSAGMTVQSGRQQTVAEYFKDSPGRSLKGLYKEGTNVEFLDNRTGKFEVARVMEVKDKSVLLFPIFKGDTRPNGVPIKFTIERSQDGRPVGLKSIKYNLRAGV